MKPASAIMLPTTMAHCLEYAHACRQLPKVARPASGTTASSAPKIRTTFRK